MIKRRNARTVNVGGLKIGSSFPIRIQSMAKTDTRDTGKTIAQLRELEKAGCEIVRVAVKDMKAAQAIKTIKRKISAPLVADIHFDYRLGLEAIKNGADKIRINPGNISKPSELKEITHAAKKRNIPIRIGLNSGSLRDPSLVTRESSEHLKSLYKIRVTSDERRVTKLVDTARKYINFFEKQGFHDIIISLKSSNVEETVSAYRTLAALCDYPFHLGVTAAGPYDRGIIKSSIGMGALLLDGIGDTIRVSLTGEPLSEVRAAKRILQALALRNFGPDIISCPTCGRCQVNLAGLVKKLEYELSAISYKLSAKRPITVAVMGCEVNGPGEARDADVGIAFGKNSGVLFKKGKIVKKIKVKNAVKELLRVTSHE